MTAREIVEAHILRRGLFVHRPQLEALIVEADVFLASTTPTLTAFSVNSGIDAELLRELWHHAVDRAMDEADTREKEQGEIESVLESIEIASMED